MSNITMNINSDFETSKISFDDFREIILNDYRLCKALAACYELQDYLANRIAEYDPENC